MTHDELLKADLAHVWHPFTQMQVWPSDEPLIIAAAEGNWLIDTHGKRWLDAISSLWVTVHGHRKQEIDEAIRAQLGRVAHSTLLGQASVPSIELAKKLIDLAPSSLTRVFYSDSGSTAVEVALKMAYQFWQLSGRPRKKRFLALEEAYHGDTLGSVSVGGMPMFHERFKDLLFDVERIPSPFPYRWSGRACLSEALRETEAIFREHHETLAALIVEPMVQGAAGMIVHPRGYLKGLEALCHEYDVLLVCDEVATGFGRTGTMFAVEHEGVAPDLMCIAKGLTGGYLPLAATLTSDRIYSAFLGSYEQQRTFFHGHTYTGNALACAAALANVDLFEREKTLARVAERSTQLRNGLEPLSRLKHVGDIRQCGLMIGIELVKDRATKEPYPFEQRIGFRVCQAARKHGVLLRPLGNVIVVMPPLSLTESEAALLIEALRDSIETTTTGATS